MGSEDAQHPHRPSGPRRGRQGRGDQERRRRAEPARRHGELVRRAHDGGAEHDFLWRIHRQAPRAGSSPSSTALTTRMCSSCACTTSRPGPCGESATITSTTSRSCSPSTGPRDQVLPAHQRRRSRRSGCWSARRTCRPRGSSTRTTGKSESTGASTPDAYEEVFRALLRASTRRGTSCRRTPSGTATSSWPRPWPRRCGNTATAG